MPADKVYIIGIGPGGASGLLPETRHIVQQADMVFGGERLLDMFASLSGQSISIKNNLSEVIDLIQQNLGQKRVVVLASGDPNLYGIAKYLVGKLGKDIVEIIPNVSPMQLAFARIKESWDDAALVSTHSRPIEDIIDTVRSVHKIAIFTDDKHTPGEVARVLQQHGIDNCRAYVCQDLGSKKEKIITTNLYSLKKMEFSPLNIMILIKDDPAKNNRPKECFGIPDEEFHRLEEGMITKLEVRAISLAKMHLRDDSVVWDIGAGSGAVSIEASFLTKKGWVLAIEKNAQAVANIKENIQKFGRYNIRVIHAAAPEGLGKLPDPSTIFVGGSGGELAGILKVACDRLKPGGRIVINAVTLDTLQAAIDSLKANGFMFDINLVNVARSRDISNLTRLEALTPVFVVAGWR
ncbi:MAG: precorrin-6y C5,15-methyltransferase (decarboxylating) subunit CbiE [Dehalococcoidia bacterium]|nr:precorrin-6y C5,15-methyltransferase (decarboxylating) subunit CbiE [Dehalococcoidia bacterium]